MTHEEYSRTEQRISYEHANNEQLKQGIEHIDRNLRMGQASEEIKPLQAVMKNIGLYDYDVDGEWGPITNRAFKKFQSMIGTRPDGVFGPDSQRKTIAYLEGEQTLQNEESTKRHEARKNRVETVRKAEAQSRRREEPIIEQTVESVPAMRLGQRVVNKAMEAYRSGNELGAGNCTEWVHAAMRQAGARDKHPHLFRGGMDWGPNGEWVQKTYKSGPHAGEKMYGKQADIDKLYPGCHLIVMNGNSGTGSHSVIVTEVLGGNKFKVVCWGSKNNIYEDIYTLNTTGEVDRKNSNFPMARALEPKQI